MHCLVKFLEIRLLWLIITCGSRTDFLCWPETVSELASGTFKVAWKAKGDQLFNWLAFLGMS